jgi:hypothetical protein
MAKKNYWDVLIDDRDMTREDLFLKIRDMYTSLMRHLYDNPMDIPDFRIHFALDQLPIEVGEKTGYPIATVTRRSNVIEKKTIHDVTQVDNFVNSYVWYQDDVFVIFDFRDEGISPFMFITQSFMHEVFQNLVSQGARKLRVAMLNELIISTGVTEFFYDYYSIDINFLQNLSAATYEKNYADSRIIASRTDGRGVRRTRRSGLRIAFSDPIDFSVENLRQIRKFLEMSNPRLALVIAETGKIRGLTDEAPQSNECEIRILGHLSWTIRFDGNKTISYHSGHYHIYVPHTGDANLKALLKKLDGSLDDAHINAITAVIARAARQPHGTILVIGKQEDIASETERIAGAKSGMRISPIQLDEDLSLIDAVTAIDGAVLMDTGCRCACIGAILDGDLVTRGALERGSRYNSARNYVMRRSEFDEHFIAVVMSEDGTIDAINEDRVFSLHLSRD